MARTTLIEGGQLKKGETPPQREIHRMRDGGFVVFATPPPVSTDTVRFTLKEDLFIMKVLVINSGSSSLKYQLIDMEDESVMCVGLCERIGIEGGAVKHEAHGKEWKVDEEMPTHAEAFAKMLDLMTTGDSAVVADKGEISAVGHRVVHGGEAFSESIVLNEEIIQQIDAFSPLAPLHNPPQILGIRSAIEVFGDKLPQTAVFDTSFHQTMPEKAFIYAIPYSYYEDLSIRRYGFHGTSHRYVSKQAAKQLGKPLEELKIITCHLGNGSSITAVDGGKSVDTSMGFTPLAGVIMGTRCGDIDPSIIPFIAEQQGKSPQEIDDILNKESGFLGVSGISSDNRDVETAAKEGNARAQLVHAILCYEIRKYIGSYAAAMGGVDCVVFTGGIGENAIGVRADACEGLGFLGIELDEKANRIQGETADLSTADATVKTLVIPTNEELMIARDTMALIQ